MKRKRRLQVLCGLGTGHECWTQKSSSWEPVLPEIFSPPFVILSCGTDVSTSHNCVCSPVGRPYWKEIWQSVGRGLKCKICQMHKNHLRGKGYQSAAYLQALASRLTIQNHPLNPPGFATPANCHVGALRLWVTPRALKYSSQHLEKQSWGFPSIHPLVSAHSSFLFISSWDLVLFPLQLLALTPTSAPSFTSRWIAPGLPLPSSSTSLSTAL